MLQATLCLGKNISDHSQCSSQGINHQIGWNISKFQLNINAGKCKMKKEKKGKNKKKTKKFLSIETTIKSIATNIVNKEGSTGHCSGSANVDI